MGPRASPQQRSITVAHGQPNLQPVSRIGRHDTAVRTWHARGQQVEFQDNPQAGKPTTAIERTLAYQLRSNFSAAVSETRTPTHGASRGGKQCGATSDRHRDRACPGTSGEQLHPGRRQQHGQGRRPGPCANDPAHRNDLCRQGLRPGPVRAEPGRLQRGHREPLPRGKRSAPTTPSAPSSAWSPPPAPPSGARCGAWSPCCCPKGRSPCRSARRVRSPAGTARFTLAITGGTGAYKTAHGQVRIVDLTVTDSRLTLTLIR